jgi:hypothetical protein
MKTRSGPLKFTEGSWRFKVHEDIWFDLTGLRLNAHVPAILSGLACIERRGTRQRLTIAAGYAWDGASGPAIDTLNFRNGSLVHDILYQMMKEGGLPATRANRKRADQVLREICRADGMSYIRATWVYLGVQTFARRWAVPSVIDLGSEYRLAPRGARA